MKIKLGKSKSGPDVEEFPIPEMPIDDRRYYEAIAGLNVETRPVNGVNKDPEAKIDEELSKYESILTSFAEKDLMITNKIGKGLEEIQVQIREKEKILEKLYPVMVKYREFYKKLTEDLRILYVLRDEFQKAIYRQNEDKNKQN